MEVKSGVLTDCTVIGFDDARGHVVCKVEHHTGDMPAVGFLLNSFAHFNWHNERPPVGARFCWHVHDGVQGPYDYFRRDRVGFTGTRDGPTRLQELGFRVWYHESAPDVVSFHQGCCVGWDERATEIVMGVEKDTPVEVHGHPSHLDSLTSKKAVGLCDKLHPVKPPLARNHDIVDWSTLMVCCPREDEMPHDPRGGGTWATYRYARKRQRPTVTIFPDGRVRFELG